MNESSKSQGYQSLVSSSCLCIASYHFKAFTLQTSGSNSISIAVLQSVGDRETEFDDKYIHVPAPLHPRTATFKTNRRMFSAFFESSQIHNGNYASGLKTFMLQHFKSLNN